jgi:hypothetical protein
MDADVDPYMYESVNQFECLHIFGTYKIYCVIILL